MPALFLLVLVLGLGWQSASALVKFDFEQRYYVHPDRQVWDFCIVRPDGLYHIFYHSIHELTPSAAYADTIWQASSPDLVHWSEPSAVLFAGPGSYDDAAIWAPDLVFDPEQQRWVMLYTGVDQNMVQRACAAYSLDLLNWTKEPGNPVFEPDTLQYYWHPDMTWSAFRDPFVFIQNQQWNMISTAHLRENGYPGHGRGIVHLATSLDLLNWSDAGAFFMHNGDGSVYWHALESSQYHVRGRWHHLYIAERDIDGVGHISALAPASWDIAEREIIDWGGAPEIDQFDPGIDIFSRLGKYQNPFNGIISYAVRFDTLTYDDDGRTPIVNSGTSFPHPLDRDWERNGLSPLGNPTFRDNPLVRGEESCGLVGYGWYGSQEYYQGPLSGRGNPGTKLGNSALGTVTSHPFFVTGGMMRLLVGGGNYPETCYVALMDAEADTIIYKETGRNSERMTERLWDLAPLQGRLLKISIVDSEMGAFGHINVDEIEELQDTITGAPLPARTGLIDYGPRPNPFNPLTEIRFSLQNPAISQVRLHDLRGRIIWSEPATHRQPGLHGVTWQGRDNAGHALASGTYIYSILIQGKMAASGKLSLVK